MTIEDLLKQKGYSEKEITDLQPLLSNPRFRADLETELTEMVKAKGDLDAYENWFNKEVAPETQQMRQDLADAKAEAAAAQARFDAYRAASMKKQGQQQDPDAAAAAAVEEERLKREAAARGAGIDPNKFVTREVFMETVDRTGDAMANAVDLVTDHMQLFPGQPLNMRTLRNEAKAAKMNVRDFWEHKYKVNDRRSAIAAEVEQKKLDAARAEGYQKAATEFGASNPNLRMPVPSASPFTTRKVEKDAKQPWERNTNELQKDRIEKAIGNAAKRGELVNV